MTLSTQTCVVTATGNGATTIWPFSFLVPYQDNGVTPALAVYLTTIATGAVATLAPSAYSVAGVGVPSGGTVTYPLSGAPLSSAYKLTIAREKAYTQPVAVGNAGFLPHTVETVADECVVQTQQLRAIASRALLTDYGTSRFNANGNPIVGLATGTESTQAVNYAQLVAAIEAVQGPFVVNGNTYNSRTTAGLATIDPAVTSIYIAGFATAGDGGGANYVEVANSGTLTLNQFKSNGATRRWELRTNVLYPEMLGAKGDGATNDTVALQAAFDTGGFVQLRAVKYNYTALTVTKTLRIAGELPGDGTLGTTLNCTAATSTTKIYVHGASQLYGVLFTDLMLSAPNSTGGKLLHFDFGANCGGRNVWMFNIGQTTSGLAIYQQNNFYWDWLRITNPVTHGVYAYGDDAHRSDLVTIDNLIVEGDSIGAGLYIPTGFMRDGLVNTIGGKTWVFVAIGHGFASVNDIGSTTRAEFVEVFDLQSDFAKYEGILVNWGDGFDFINAYCHGSLTGNNITINHVSPNTVDNIFFTGGQCTSAYLSGMFLDGNYTKVVGMEISTNGLASPGTYHGVELGANSLSTIITACHIGQRSGVAVGTQKYGVYARTGASSYSVSGNDLVGNVTAAVGVQTPVGNSTNVIAPNLGQSVPNSIALNVPVTGFSLNAGICEKVSLYPAGTLAAGTVIADPNPYDGQPFGLFSTQTITALTLDGGGNVFNPAPTTIAANTSLTYTYSQAATTWYRSA